MSLEKTFQNVKKLPKEKKLEVITSKEATIKDLRAYFEKNKYERSKDWDSCKKYLNSYMDFLKSFQVTPKIISEFNTKTGGIVEFESFGVFLSALVQTSYNQGCNNFKFEKVNANCFGAFLKGQEENPIMIEVKNELKGYENLSHAKNCILKTKTLERYGNLGFAEACLIEIQNYRGIEFGYAMKNCTIKSENQETLEKIKKQVWNGVNNKFELKK